MPITFTVQDLTTPGTFTDVELERMVWALRYQALYQYNRSPWVEHGYSEAIADVVLIPRGAVLPPASWHIELLDTSDQEGALGYHQDQAFDQNSSGARKASDRSSRGLRADSLQPLAKVFVKTSQADGVSPSSVASHEMLETAVDPQVTDEASIRKYLNTATGQFYIGEVGDPVQGEDYDVGAPEGRPCGWPEAIVSNFAWPAWFGAAQTRTALDFRGTRRAPFELAAAGYMSVAPEGDPSAWTQIFGQ